MYLISNPQVSSTFRSAIVANIPYIFFVEVKKISTNYTGTLRNLSNNFCDFASGIIDYKICVYHEGLTECFQNPCGNGKVYTSLCGGNAVDNETVSLEVNGVENGTIVSIYCQREDCRSRPSNLLLFNIQICKCKCKKNFTNIINLFFSKL